MQFFFSYIVNLKLETVQESNWSAFQIPIKFITINPISGLIGQIYWWIMDLFTKIVGLTRILLEKIGVANIPILSRPHVLVEVLVQFRAMRPGEITHMPLFGPVTRQVCPKLFFCKQLSLVVNYSLFIFKRHNLCIWQFYNHFW